MTTELEQTDRIEAEIRELLHANPYTEYSYLPQNFDVERERSERHAIMLLKEQRRRLVSELGKAEPVAQIEHYRLHLTLATRITKLRDLQYLPNGALLYDRPPLASEADVIERCAKVCDAETAKYIARQQEAEKRSEVAYNLGQLDELALRCATLMRELKPNAAAQDRTLPRIDEQGPTVDSSSSPATAATNPAPGHTDLMVPPESIGELPDTTLDALDPGPTPYVDDGIPLAVMVNYVRSFMCDCSVAFGHWEVQWFDREGAQKDELPEREPTRMLRAVDRFVEEIVAPLKLKAQQLERELSAAQAELEHERSKK